MEQEEYLETTENRLEHVVSDIIAMNDADDRMMAIMETLNDTVVTVPDIGRFYTFIYDPKTPRIRYDEFPLIACVGLFRWGFRGINYHWPGFRNYDWQQSIGNLYQAYPLEINDLRSIPYQRFRINN